MAEEKDPILTSMFEGILAAYNLVIHENNDPFTNCNTFAYTALAALEADGFKVVRNEGSANGQRNRFN